MVFFSVFMCIATIATADILFCMALGATKLYRQPERRLAYITYYKTIWSFGSPYLLVHRFGNPRFSLKVRHTRQYIFYMAAACCLSCVTCYIFYAHMLQCAAALLVGQLLLAMVYVDLRTRYLPDFFMLPILILSILSGIGELFISWQQALAGGLLGFGMMWTINALFKLVRHKEGMGFGDFILTGILGLWVGPLLLPLILFLSSILGLIGAIGYGLLVRGEIQQQFAFGPALACAGWVVFFCSFLNENPLLVN